MFIDFVECPHAGGVFIGQNTRGTLKLNRWVYRRSKMDDMVAALSEGVNHAELVRREGGLQLNLNRTGFRRMFSFERCSPARAKNGRIRFDLYDSGTSLIESGG